MWKARSPSARTRERLRAHARAPSLGLEFPAPKKPPRSSSGPGKRGQGLPDQVGKDARHLGTSMGRTCRLNEWWVPLWVPTNLVGLTFWTGERRSQSTALRWPSALPSRPFARVGVHGSGKSGPSLGPTHLPTVNALFSTMRHSVDATLRHAPAVRAVRTPWRRLATPPILAMEGETCARQCNP